MRVTSVFAIHFDKMAVNDVSFRHHASFKFYVKDNNPASYMYGHTEMPAWAPAVIVL